MYIIQIAANSYGHRPPIQTWTDENPPEGYVLCPDEFVETFYSTNPAGFVNITIEGNKVTSMVVNQEAYDAYVANNPSVEKTPSQKREEAYNTERIIEWDGEMLTVTETAELWLYYSSEGNEKATRLQELIVEAKKKIREKYPDPIEE